MSDSIGRINLDLGINSSGFKKDLNGIEKTAKRSTDQMSGMFGKLGKVIAVAFAVKKVADFAKSCLQLGSDLNEVQNVVDVTFGSMAGKVNEFAKSAMTAYGLSEKVAKEYMGQFGAMSKAFGNTTEAAYEQSEALTALTGDIASFFNLSTDEAFTKLKSVYTGETESLKSLGVVMTQAALDEFALAKGYGKTTKAMSEQEKVSLRLAFVTDRLSAASGDFSRTAGGWANQTRVLSLRFDALKASIGQGLINVLTPVIKLLNELLAKLQAAAEAFKNFTVAIFGDSSAASTMASASGELAENMESGASSAAAIKKSLAGFDKINILSSSSGSSDSVASSISSASGTSEAEKTNEAAEKIRAKLSQIKDIILKISEMTGLSDLFNKAVSAADNVKSGVKNIFNSFSEAVNETAPNLEKMKSSLGNTFLGISNTLTGIWGDMWLIMSDNFRQWTEENGEDLQLFFGNIIKAFADTTTLISDAVGDVFADIQAWWESDGKPVFDGFCKAIGDVWKWILDIYNIVIAPVIEKITGILEELWDETLHPIWGNLFGLFSDIGECLLTFWNNILKPAVDWIIKNFGPPISKVFQKVADVVGVFVKAVSGLLNGLISVLRGVMQFLTGVFSGDWKKAWDGIKKIFSGIWEAMSSVVTPIVNGIMGAVEGFINGIIGGLNWLIKQINKISFDVPDWVPLIGGKKLGFSVKEVSTVKLPRLATGGYVAANTPRLAIVGDNKREGEIIAPESKIAEAVAKGFSMVLAKLQGQQSKQPIYLTVKLGEDNFWEGFVDYHNSVVKMTGESPLLV